MNYCITRKSFLSNNEKKKARHLEIPIPLENFRNGKITLK